MAPTVFGRNVAALAAGPRQERREIEPFSPAEIRTLLTAVAGHRLEGLIVTAVTRGMRSGEMLGVSWADVELDRGTLTARHALRKLDGEWDLVPPKSSTSRRTIALQAMTAAALRAHRVRLVEEHVAAGPEWSGKWDLVFMSAIGTPLDASNVLHAFHRILRDAGLPRRRLHDLRHSAATALLVSGVSPRVIQSILGHSQVSLTLGTYSHAIVELQTDAAERMDALLAAR
jgi:integrase